MGAGRNDQPARFCVDRDLAEAARKIAQAAAPEIDTELAVVTGGAVTGVNQVARLLVWLKQNRCTAEDLTEENGGDTARRCRAAAERAARA